MKENKDIIMRADDWRDFKTATKCFICGQWTLKKEIRSVEMGR